jgi:hypothetical protein
MKVALALSGLPRLYLQSTLSWQKFIQKYNCDVFIHTWGDTTTKHQILNYYSPKLLEIEHPKTFDISLYKDRIWPHRSSPANVISSWYSINSALTLCERYYNHIEEDYDIICRGRFDWWCKDIVLNISSNLTVPDDPGLNGHHFNFNGPRIAHNDQFAFSNKVIMKEYANTYNAIPDLYQKGVDFCSELFLTANMIDKSIDVDFQKMHYGILRG